MMRGRVGVVRQMVEDEVFVSFDADDFVVPIKDCVKVSEVYHASR